MHNDKHGYWWVTQPAAVTGTVLEDAGDRLCCLFAITVCRVHFVNLLGSFITRGGRVLTVSFMYRRNRVGKRTLHCRTPSLSLISLLRDPSFRSGCSVVQTSADPSVNLTRHSCSQQFPLESFLPHSVKRLKQAEEEFQQLSILLERVFNVLSEECELIFRAAMLTVACL